MCISQNLIEASANVNHLTEVGGVKRCAVSSGKDVIYSLSPWRDVWCLSTMSGDHKMGVQQRIQSTLFITLFSETLVLAMVISGNPPSQTECDTSKAEKPNVSWTAVSGSSCQGKLVSPTMAELIFTTTQILPAVFKVRAHSSQTMKNKIKQRS